MVKRKILTIGIFVAFFALIFVFSPLLQISTNSAIQTQLQKTNRNINENFHYIPSGATTLTANNGPFWTYSQDTSQYTSPVIVNGYIYVGSSDSNVYCINPSTGTRVWYFTADSSIVSAPTVVNGYVYVTSSNGYVYCLDASTGTQQWYYNMNYISDTSPVVSNGMVYTTAENYEMYALDASTHSLVWENETGYSWDSFSTPTIANGLVYVGTTYGHICCYNGNTGNQEWFYDTGDYINTYTSPVVANGLVYSGGDYLSGKLYCLNANTGGEDWIFQASTDGIAAPPMIANGYLYMADEGGNVYCLNANTRSLIWNQTINCAFDTTPAVSNGFLYIGGEDGNLYCLDTNSGALEWIYNTGNEIESSPVISNGMVYVGNDGGNFYCFPMIMPPSAPLNPSITTGDKEVTLTWNTPSLSGGSTITGYNIFRGTSSGSEQYITSTTDLQYTDSGLTNGQTYYYEITAKNTAGGGQKSIEVNGIPATTPSQPQNLQATPGNRNILLSWNASSNNGGLSITAYKIYRGTSAGSETLLTTIGDVTQFNDTGLTNGQTYYYTISAVNAKGESPKSTETHAAPSSHPSINGMGIGEILAVGVIGVIIVVSSIKKQLK